MKILADMTFQDNTKNISNTLSKVFVEQQVTPVDEQNKQVDDDFTLIKRKENIKKINLEDFPTPGSVILTKEQEKEIVTSNKLNCVRKVELEVTNHRTIAFNHMANKDTVAKALLCTKGCRNIQRDTQTGEFGVCFRKYCTFAHSMAELQPSRCSFDLSCRFRNGRIIDWDTRTIAPGSKCKFHHSNETIDQYYSRSGMTRPDLPPTSEHTRKIPEKSESNEESNEESKQQPKQQPKQTNEEKKVSRKAYDSESSESESEESESDESESEESESEESESEEDRRRRIKKERRSRKSRKSGKSRKSKSPKNDIQVIRVPTKELAEIALKAAFDRGQFNVQVFIE